MQDSKFFPEIHGNFGFGCMRLPMMSDAGAFITGSTFLADADRDIKVLEYGARQYA